MLLERNQKLEDEVKERTFLLENRKKELEEYINTIQTLESLHRSILNNTPDGIAVLSKWNDLLITNQTFRSIMSEVREDSLNTGDDFTPVLKFFFQENYSELIDVLEYEPRLFTKTSIEIEGRRVYYDIEFATDERSQNRIFYIRDVSDQEKALRDLEQSESLFRSLVDRMRAGVYVIQSEKVLFVNEQLRSIFDVPQDLSPEQLNLKEIIHPDDFQRVQKNIAMRLEGEIESVRYEARGIKFSGSEIWFEALGNVFEYEGRRAIIGTLIDITDRKRKERETANQLHALEEISFITSHELRNEHVKLNGIIQLLQNIDVEDDDLKMLIKASIPIFENLDLSIQKLNNYVRDSSTHFTSTIP